MEPDSPKFDDSKKGSIKDQTQLEVQRSPGFTKGHYLSKLSVVTKSSDGETVPLASVKVQSWADKDNVANDNNFTMLAGDYTGRLLKNSGSYNRPILLSNSNLGMIENDSFLVHPNEMRNGFQWYNTGGSLGCQVTQGGQKSYDSNIANTLISAGYSYNNSDTINVKIKDPAGIVTTQNSGEINRGSRGRVPW